MHTSLLVLVGMLYISIKSFRHSKLTFQNVSMYTDAEGAQSLMSPVLIFELLNITANNPTEHPLY
jgi:hypothetical protein